MTLAIFLLMLSVALNPSSPLKGAEYSVKLCISSVIPSMLPIMVLNNILLMSGAFERSFGFAGKFFSKIFRLPQRSIAPIVTGLLSGYPTGAKTAGDLYDKGTISPSDYNRLISFCNCAGPGFVIGTAGTALLNSADTGRLLFVIHVISAFTVGIIFRFRGKGYDSSHNICSKSPKLPLAEAFTSSVESAVDTMGKICGYIIFFGMLMSKIEPFILKLPLALSVFLYGFFEMTGGISKTACSALSYPLKTATVSAILGWGGWCVHMQSMKYIKNKKSYLTGKALQGMISFVITYFTVKTRLGQNICPSFTTPSRLSLALILSILVFYLIFSAVPRRASRLRKQAS